MESMEHRENRARNVRRIDPMKIAVVVLSILLLVCLIVALNLRDKPDASESTGGSTEDTTVESTGQVSAADPEIMTPIGTLTLPEEWLTSMKVEDISADGRFSVRVSGAVAGGWVTLFELSVGGGTGYQLGEAPDKDGKMLEIWLNISEIKAQSDWSQEQTTQINLMQSSVNDLIDQIYGLDGFQAG